MSEGLNIVIILHLFHLRSALEKSRIYLEFPQVPRFKQKSFFIWLHSRGNEVKQVNFASKRSLCDPFSLMLQHR